jgi:D-alanyl-D-alanine carboxypeptidase (penicillin-binding protein 5/6)
VLTPLRLSLVAALALASPPVGPGAALAQSFQTMAPQAVLLDVDTGAVLLDVGGDAAVAPASLVKLMTAELVFREIAEGRLKPDDEFVTSENAWRKGGAPAGGSSMFIVPNSRVKISDLLQGLIVASGNDAAIALAEGISGTEENFARAMTQRARELGLARSTFVNSNGWNAPEQRVTMREMARLADHIIKTYPEQYKLFAQRDMTWNRTKQQNRNPLLTMDIGADGLKTGFIEQSGYSLVGSAVQNGQRLIVAMSGLKTARDRQIEAKKILDWGFRSFEVRTLLSPGAKVGEASVYGGSKSSVGLVTRHEVRLPTPRGGTERMSAKIVYKGPVKAPIASGAEVARLHVFRGNTKVMDAPLLTEEAVERGTLTQRASDAAVELGRALIKGGFQRATGKADPKPEPKPELRP